MRRLYLLPLACACALPAAAAEIKVLSAGAVGPGVIAFARLVQNVTGDDLNVQYDTAPQIAQRLAAGEMYDILIAPPAVVLQAAKEGRLAPGDRIPVGRVGIGVAVRSDVALPDVSTVDRLTRALAAADAVVYNTASSGLYLDRLFEQLGILGLLETKSTRYADGAAVMEHLLRGSGNELGFGAITEIRYYEPRGLRLAGPLPTVVQNYTSYEAALMTAAAAPLAAKAALALLATPGGRAAFASGGVD